MSWWTRNRKYLNPIHAIDDTIEWANENLKGGDENFYIGINNGTPVVLTGDAAEATMSSKLGGYNYGNVGRSTTTAYKANTAGTANKIAQGGMTKDDILKYNAIHPNEIAGDNPANTTALNTNTALRSK